MKILYKNKHWKLNKEYDIDKILYLLVDRPNHIDAWNDFTWIDANNKKHRKYDLPALCGTNDGYVAWYINNKFHRENNRPSIINFEGNLFFYINDKIINKIYFNKNIKS